MNKANETDNLEYALQVLINKAEDKEGKRLFSEADRASLRREIPLSVLTDIMFKIQGAAEEVDTVNSKKHILRKITIYIYSFSCVKS